MRLSLLLMVLALCCLQANSDTCPHLVYELHDYMLDYPHSFEFHLAKFGAPREAVDAALKVKKCTDQISLWKRYTLLATLNGILRDCSKANV